MVKLLFSCLLVRYTNALDPDRGHGLTHYHQRQGSIVYSLILVEFMSIVGGQIREKLEAQRITLLHFDEFMLIVEGQKEAGSTGDDILVL